MGQELRRTQDPEARQQLVFAMQRYATEQQHYVYLYAQMCTGFLAALRENLCPVFGRTRSQEALEERRNLWRHRREMDRKTVGALRDGPHDLGVEIAREFFPIAVQELDLNIAPGLDGMLGAYLAVFGRQRHQTAGAYSITDVFPFQQGELQRDRLRQWRERDGASRKKEVILPADPPGVVNGNRSVDALGRDLDLLGHLHERSDLLPRGLRDQHLTAGVIGLDAAGEVHRTPHYAVLGASVRTDIPCDH